MIAQSSNFSHTAWRGTLYRDSTKREARRRDFPLHSELKPMIQNWRRQSGGKDKTPLCLGRDGESPMWPNVWLDKRIMPQPDESESRM